MNNEREILDKAINGCEDLQSYYNESGQMAKWTAIDAILTLLEGINDGSFKND